jgi:sec-independent protein translocase protein TatA
MNVFGVGLPEMALILVLALLVFGPKKLPEIGRSLGKALTSFQKASKEFEEELKREAQQVEKAVSSPMKAALETEPPKALSPQDSPSIPVHKLCNTSCSLAPLLPCSPACGCCRIYDVLY